MQMEKIIQANLNGLKTPLPDKIQTGKFFHGCIEDPPKKFTIGRGRLRLVMDMFAIRLMHLGLNVHAIGEPTTPAMRSGDLLVIGSGSGKTEGPKMAAIKAPHLGLPSR